MKSQFYHRNRWCSYTLNTVCICRVFWKANSMTCLNSHSTWLEVSKKWYRRQRNFPSSLKQVFSWGPQHSKSHTFLSKVCHNWSSNHDSMKRNKFERDLFGRTSLQKKGFAWILYALCRRNELLLYIKKLSGGRIIMISSCCCSCSGWYYLLSFFTSFVFGNHGILIIS